MKAPIHHVTARVAGSRRMPRKRSPDPNTNTDAPVGRCPGWSRRVLRRQDQELSSVALARRLFITILMWNLNTCHNWCTKLWQKTWNICQWQIGNLEIVTYKRLTESKVKSCVFFKCVLPTNSFIDYGNKLSVDLSEWVAVFSLQALLLPGRSVILFWRTKFLVQCESNLSLLNQPIYLGWLNTSFT